MSINMTSLTRTWRLLIADTSQISRSQSEKFLLSGQMLCKWQYITYYFGSFSNQARGKSLAFYLLPLTCHEWYPDIVRKCSVTNSLHSFATHTKDFIRPTRNWVLISPNFPRMALQCVSIWAACWYINAEYTVNPVQSKLYKEHLSHISREKCIRVEYYKQ